MFCFNTEHICFIKNEIFSFELWKKKLSKVEIFPRPWLVLELKYMFHILPNSLSHTPRKMSWMGDFLVSPLFVVPYPIHGETRLGKFEVASHIHCYRPVQHPGLRDLENTKISKANESPIWLRGGIWNFGA